IVLPDYSAVAFTTPYLGDGFQLYIQRGANSAEVPVDDPQQLTHADAGVHGIKHDQKASRLTLTYSMDGATYKSEIRSSSEIQSTKISDDIRDIKPLIADQKSGITLQGAKRCHKKEDTKVAGIWCVNARGGYSSREKCESTPPAGDHTPLINVWKFEVVPTNNANGGVSFYYGQETDGD
ncbi:hypothetical protein, partial [Haloferax sp. Atlit-109R]|uniref:hypothetical protein n=1 Tax=Haloferax sp. Atlit-109R TaxID=2282134 RepID=UPI0013140A32